MCSKKAYTLIETLLVIMMLPFLLSLTFSLLRLLTKYEYDFTERQNFIGIIQVRKRIAIGSEISLKDQRLQMMYQNQSIEIFCYEDKLIEYDGYMEYLIGLDHCELMIDQGRIILKYELKDDTKQIFLGYVN
jgi:competence protein ComGF